jgi:hypothetical protein
LQQTIPFAEGASVIVTAAPEKEQKFVDQFPSLTGTSKIIYVI